MNSRQKEIMQEQLDQEKAVLRKLERNYADALKQINHRLEILMSRQDADMAHVIYQVEYQKALKTQVQSILEQLQTNEFETISEYLANAYNLGFVGAMYDMHGQGVPLIIPVDQKQVVEAIQHETKLEDDLYTRLGKDVKELQKEISSEISRGISTGMSYGEVARNIAAFSQIPLNKAMTISRTEAHRIQMKATADVQHKAKERGADVLKQWDATLDGHTRKSHRKLDGQTRELDEPFEVNGHKAMQPGDFNRPEEDINCRCGLLQKARWALEAGFSKYDAFTGNIRTFNSPQDYEEFKKWYFSKENTQYMNYVETLEKRYKTKNFGKILEQMSDGEYNHFRKLESSSPMWKEHEKITKSAVYAVDSKVINNRKFVSKFEKMTDDSAQRREYLSNAKEMLKHRSGQNGEDLYLYNLETKKWVKSTSGSEAGTPEYTDEIRETIKKSSKGSLVAFHNHPASMPPSVDDINAARGNGYAKGYIYCHNGTIFEYTASSRYIDKSLYDIRLAVYKEKGYNEYEAQLETMKYLAAMYGFVFNEVE